MSGGSLNYICYKVQDAAMEIRGRAGIYSGQNKALLLAFAAHIDKVQEALHDVEWLFSGDYGEDQIQESVRACMSTAYILETATAQAELALKELTAAIQEAKKS